MTLPPLEELKRLNGRRDLPWKVTENNAVTDRFGWSIFVDEETNDTAGTATPQDAQLVALAPDLLAEVIRMKEELIHYVSGLEAAGDEDAMRHPPEERRVFRAVAKTLTRILNGETNV